MIKTNIINFMVELTPALDFFARGGGGGSGGGGGGGGSGEGDGPGVIAFIGYLVGYGINKPIKKYAKPERVVLFSLIATGLTTFVLALPLLLLTNFLAIYIDLLIIAGLWMGWYTAIFDVFTKLRKRFKKTDEAIAKAATTDQIWNEEQMKPFVKTTFINFQNDWSKMDSAKFINYMTPEYAQKNSYFIEVLRGLGRQNAVLNAKVVNCETLEISDQTDNTKDTFTMLVEGQANDVLLTINERKQLFTETKNFYEYWKFVRSGNSWLLYDIEQHTANIAKKDSTIEQFALQNNLFYSLDMGWLFLPENGAIFSKSSFGLSDINNHVVGSYEGLLIQLYSFIPRPGEDTSTYTIGQITLPKSYGNIVIKPKMGMLQQLYHFTLPKNLTKYQFEWNDFNREFEVYASDPDRLAAFELINPKFMATMYDIDEKIILEVVDNIVYFRVPSKKSSNYPALLELLKQAHKELKL
jgi:hypothetical protein